MKLLDYLGGGGPARSQCSTASSIRRTLEMADPPRDPGNECEPGVGHGFEDKR